jgi:hypothetical protein
MFTVFGERELDRAVDLLDALAPTAFPSFVLCWLQLTMHGNAFPRFFGSKEPRTVGFCLRCILLSIRLAVDYPELLYKGVLQVLITVAAVAPLFFTSYHCLLIERLPDHYVQFRNIILAATPQWRSEIPPPIGFSVAADLQGTVLRTVLDPFLSPSDGPVSQSAAQFITATLKRSLIEPPDRNHRLIWEFVFFCIATVSPNMSQFANARRIPIVDLFVSISVFFNESVCFLIEAILDHVRFPNPHTMFAIKLLCAIFIGGNDLCREIIIGVLLKRMLCVTPPPRALARLFEKLIGRYSPPPATTVAQKAQAALFTAARAAAVALEDRFRQ